jgi:hypothetical protein
MRNPSKSTSGKNDLANLVMDGGTDEEDGYVGLCQYFRNMVRMGPA